MKTESESKSFWVERYAKGETGWDIGSVSEPLKAYIDQITNKELAILVPGAGNAYEAEYLWQSGFRNLVVIDIAEAPLELFSKRVPDFPKQNLICTDFFEHRGKYDLIIEQTFFCAISPDDRLKYAQKCHELLKKKGKLVGLLFDFPLTEAGPPYGGDFASYKIIFADYFDFRSFAPCYNSIKPRLGRELFFIFEKKIIHEMSRSVILTNEEITNKIRRIAYQIYETNINEKEIVLAGISENGFILAKKLKAVLEKVSPIRVLLCDVKINKANVLDTVTTSLKPEEYRDKSLVLVDDVLNSGAALMYAVRHFLDVPLKKFKTAVLVNRNHKKYPVKADFKGISLSTSLQEHITVEFGKSETIAYLD